MIQVDGRIVPFVSAIFFLSEGVTPTTPSHSLIYCHTEPRFVFLFIQYIFIYSVVSCSDLRIWLIGRFPKLLKFSIPSLYRGYSFCIPLNSSVAFVPLNS